MFKLEEKKRIFLILDNGICIQSKFIFLDAQLMFFMIAAIFCWIKFRQFRRQSFSKNWWKWLTGTGLFLGLNLGVKFVGLFAYALIGIVTIIDLWELTDIKRKLSLVIRSIFKFIFFIYRKILSNTG